MRRALNPLTPNPSPRVKGRGGPEVGRLPVADNLTANLQRCLDRLGRGEEAARKELLGIARERLAQLTHAMLRDYRRLKRWEETDDICQTAMMRLDRALQSTTPASLRDFYRLATVQIRRELIDLARHYFGPEGEGANRATNAPGEDSPGATRPAYERADSSDGPSQLIAWREFHEQVSGLPEEEREVFDLVWYQGWTHTQAAELLDVSARTVKRRWQSACLRLHQLLGGELPGA